MTHCCVHRLLCALLGLALCWLTRSATAQAEHAWLVLWLPPASAELGKRIEGQLIDTRWRLQAAREPAAQPTRDSQLRAAFAGAREHSAQAVAWVNETQHDISVLILDVRRSRLSERPVPSAPDPEAQSAAFETVALIVRSTLLSIESGAEVGNVVVEPAPPQQPVPASPTPVESPPPARTPVGARGIEPWLRVGARGMYNLGRVLPAAELGAGLAFGAARFGVTLRGIAPHTLRTTVDNRPDVPVTLALWRIAPGVSAEYAWNLGQDWEMFGAGRLRLDALQRTTRSAPVLSSSSELYWLPGAGVALGLATPPLLGDVLRAELELTLDYLARAPRFLLGPEPGLPLQEQLSRWEPGLGVGLRFP